MELNNGMKNILIGVSGSIATYKIPDLIRHLVDRGFQVKVVLTENASQFITPLTLHTLSGNTVHSSLLDYQSESTMGHIELARWADLVLVAPASANFIAKLAHGLANDLLSTLCLATNAPIAIAPAMNQNMWNNIAVQTNIATIQSRSISIVGPNYGLQACKDIGLGRMSEIDEILNFISTQSTQQLLKGLNILITAGSTHEPIDPVRFIANRSSGKMGYAIAEIAANMGANITLVTGKATIPLPINCNNFICVNTADEMFEAVKLNLVNQNIFISCAAVSDYRVVNQSPQKLKRNSLEKLNLFLEPNVDILSTVAKNYEVFTVGFAAETENIVKNARNKLIHKNIDMIVANDVSTESSGFESNNNEVFILSGNNYVEKILLADKKIIASQCMYIMHKLYSSKMLQKFKS